MTFRPRAFRQQGFTLIELIAVLVIVGIMAAVAAPRFLERNTFDVRAFSDQLRATLRYAQKTAIAQHRFVCVSVTTSSLSLRYGSNSDCSSAGAALATSDGSSALTTANGVTITGSSFSFDALGRPVNSSTAAVLATQTLSLAASGSTLSMTVEAETGYVH